MELPDKFARDLALRLECAGVIVIVLTVKEDGSGTSSTAQMYLNEKRVAMQLPEIIDQLKIDAVKSLEAHELL